MSRLTRKRATRKDPIRTNPMARWPVCLGALGGPATGLRTSASPTQPELPLVPATLEREDQQNEKRKRIFVAMKWSVLRQIAIWTSAISTSWTRNRIWKNRLTNCIHSKRRRNSSTFSLPSSSYPFSPSSSSIRNSRPSSGRTHSRGILMISDATQWVALIDEQCSLKTSKFSK